MSDFVGFRLNKIKDADIIEDLSKYKDTTARVKEAYRRAIEAENAPYVASQLKNTSEVVSSATLLKKPEKIVWNFPKEPTVPTSLKDTILSNGF